jgi:hypothetical protein
MNEELRFGIPEGYKIDEYKSTSITIVLKKINCFESESFWFQGFKYSTVMSPTTGRVWLDRNLGARCTKDYGGYFMFDEAVCPNGYEVPSHEEWGDELTSGSDDDVNWLKIPLAGARMGGNMTTTGLYARMWSRTDTGTTAHSRLLHTRNSVVACITNNKAHGFSVRLIKQ